MLIILLLIYYLNIIIYNVIDQLFLASTNVVTVLLNKYSNESNPLLSFSTDLKMCFLSLAGTPLNFISLYHNHYQIHLKH